MQAPDIPQVLDIERQSFPTMWPQTIYQRELKNRMARYVVLCEPLDLTSPPAVPSAPASRSTGSLLRRLFATPPPAAPADHVLGIVGVWLMMGEAHVVTIAVRHESRRQGIGEVLLIAALEAAVEGQQEEVTLEYRISNAGARALYEKYGFRQVGVRARYYTDNQEDAVLMTTPPLGSPTYRELLAQRIAEQRVRWGDGYPLAGQLTHLVAASARDRERTC